MSQNLFLAICEEHKARTKHDVFTQGPLDTTHITCNVCLYLHAEKRRMEVEEKEYFEQLHFNAMNSNQKKE